MNKTLLFASIILGTVLLGSTVYDSAFAAVDMFLKIEGIEGESKDKGHSNEIDVLSWSWGMSQSGTSHTGGGGGAGKANFEDLSVTKYLDKSSPKLYKTLATGEPLRHVSLEFVDKDYSGTEPYLIITMKDVLVTSVSTGGSGEDRLTENVSLNFAEVEVKYQPFEKKKPSGSPVIFTWNIAENHP